MSILDSIRKKFPGFVLWTHKMRGVLAYLIFGRLTQNLKIIGVTGTNGKTTTCFMVTSILEADGKKVGMSSTTTFKIGSNVWQNKTNKTTLSPFRLQKMLARMVKEGCEYAVVETSSHAIIQHRNWGLKYYGLAMTNIEPEHLDYHKNLSQYVAAKAQIFARNPAVAVVNLDDEQADKFLHFSAGKVLTYSTKKIADIVARKILPDLKGMIFTLVTPEGQTSIALKLTGIFNVENALCASALAVGMGIKLSKIKRGLEAMNPVPGRMEKVDEGQKFNVIIDYAVTPKSFEKIYSQIKKITSGKLIAVFGATGDRDRSKRPKLGEAADKLADVVILTDEEPYSEDPARIIEEVAEGIKNKKLEENYFKIMNREQAIAKALSLASEGDSVVVTGMGDQSYRIVGKRKIPYSERKVIKIELNKLGFKKKR